MSPKKKLELLEQTCREIGVKLYYDDLRSEGGFCRLRDTYYLILNRRAAVETRVRIISEALAKIPQAAERAALAQAQAETKAAVAEAPAPVQAEPVEAHPAPQPPAESHPVVAPLAEATVTTQK